MKKLRIVVKRSRKNSKWYFNVVSGNNEIISSSQAYGRVDSCLKTVSRLKEDMASAAVEFESEE